MPFPFVFRIPQSITDKTLLELRRELVRITVEKMGCPVEWVGPDFFRSSLPDPEAPEDGCDTILVKLETGNFAGRPDNDPQIQATLKALTGAVMTAFGGRYEVEGTVSGWHSGWTFLRAPGQFDCRMSGCEGILSEEIFPMQTGCYAHSPCRTCLECGRVHSYDGGLMFGRAGHSPFLKDGVIELVLEPVEFLIGELYQTTSKLLIEVGEDCEYEHLPAGTVFFFERMDGETFCFRSRGEDGAEYRLHRGDVNFVEPV